MIRISPFLVLTVVGALTAISMMRVRFSASLYELLPPDLPEVQGMDRLSRFFSRDGQLIVTVKANEPTVAAEATASLSAYLERQGDLVSAVYREFSLPELVAEGGSLLAWIWLNGPPEKFDQLAGRLREGQSSETIADSMEAIQSGFMDETAVITSYDPLGFSRLAEVLGESSFSDGASGPDPMASDDGTFRLLYVEGKGADFSDYRDAAVWLKNVKTVVGDWETEWRKGHPHGAEIRIGLTGTPAFMAEIGREMEKDMTLSVSLTMLLISLLFWVMHRQSRALGWLMSVMLAILGITLNLGGLIFGNLSVMSAGFAAVLMGLAFDYGIVMYREALGGNHDPKALRKVVGPSIFWAAMTTAVVFLSLNFSSVPGLAELGNLVAIGVAVGAVVVLFLFAPIAAGFSRESAPRSGIQLTGRGFSRHLAGWAAVLVPLLALISMLAKEMPNLEPNFHPFRIRESPSMIAWKELQGELRGRERSSPTIITGDSPANLIENLAAFGERVREAKRKGLLQEAVLPGPLVPAPDNQRINRLTIREMIGEEERLLGEIGDAGFSVEGQALTASIFEAWSHYLDQLEEREIAQPVGKLAEWTIGRLFSEKDDACAALASVTPADPKKRAWVEAICDQNAAVASLGSLGTALNTRIRADLLQVFLPLSGLLIVMLIIVFRDWRDILLSLFSLFFAATGLILLTVWTPLRWNSFNVCGLPLLFGIGLDFSIHMIFALRRHCGDVARARQGIGKALIFCGLSSAIGFGSLATASAHGLSSLGIVCATGILLIMSAAVWFLPRWYGWLHRLEKSGPDSQDADRFISEEA